MKKLLLLFVLIISVSSLQQCSIRIPPLTTYSIEGEIEIISECSGIAPKPIDIQVNLYYQGKTISKIRRIKLNNGVGDFDISDVPTNRKAIKWVIIYPEICKYDLCPVDEGECVDTATNIKQTYIITSTITKASRYRYACVCQ